MKPCDGHGRRIATGILGWVIGNYLRISHPYLLKSLFY